MSGAHAGHYGGKTFTRLDLLVFDYFKIVFSIRIFFQSSPVQVCLCVQSMKDNKMKKSTQLSAKKGRLDSFIAEISPEDVLLLKQTGDTQEAELLPVSNNDIEQGAERSKFNWLIFLQLWTSLDHSHLLDVIVAQPCLGAVSCSTREHVHPTDWTPSGRSL